MSSAVYSTPVRPRPRSRRRRTAVATATFGYFAAYGAAVLGVLAVFAPTGTAALLALAGALLLGVITVVLLAIDKLRTSQESPHLRALA